jgi:SAM-dependent methyltransferase
MQYASIVGGNYRGLDVPSSDHVVDPPHIVGSAENIPLGDCQTDVVFGVATFYYMEDIARVFAECHRILRPGGWLIVFDYQAPVVRRMIQRGDSAARHCWDARELRGRLRAAGFGRIRDLSHRAAETGDPPLYRRPVRLAKRMLTPDWTQWLVLEAQRS